MRTFHTILFDGYVNGTVAVYSPADLQEVLGVPDALVILGYAAQVSGTSPTLQVQIEQSFDERRWLNRSAVPEVNGLALSAVGETTISGFHTSYLQLPILAFARVRIQLGGTSPAAQIRLWVTGRDRAEN